MEGVAEKEVTIVWSGLTKIKLQLKTCFGPSVCSGIKMIIILI